MKKDIFTLLLLIVLSLLSETAFHLYNLKISNSKATEMTLYRRFKADDNYYNLQWFTYDANKTITLKPESTENQASFYLNHYNYNIKSYYDLPILTDGYMKKIVIWLLTLNHQYKNQFNISKAKTIFFDNYLPAHLGINALIPNRKRKDPSLHFKLSAFQTIQKKHVYDVSSEQYLKTMKRNIENLNHFSEYPPALILHIETFGVEHPLSGSMINIIPLSNFSPDWKELFFVSRIEATFTLGFSYFSGCQVGWSKAHFLNIETTQIRNLFNFTRDEIYKLSRAGCNIEHILIYTDKKGPIFSSDFDSGLIYYSKSN